MKKYKIILAMHTHLPHPQTATKFAHMTCTVLCVKYPFHWLLGSWGLGGFFAFDFCFVFWVGSLGFEGPKPFKSRGESDNLG